MSQVILKHVRDFLPDHVFDCGQAFRWQREEDGSYTGIVGGRIANIRFDQQEENTGAVSYTHLALAQALALLMLLLKLKTYINWDKQSPFLKRNGDFIFLPYH